MRQLQNVIAALVLFTFIPIASCSLFSSSDPDRAPDREILRGFNISPQADNNVLNTVIARTGANVIRLSFGGSNRLVNKTAPYDFNEAAFQHLNRILDWAERSGVRVIIDPHTTPGTKSDWTIYPDDEFWQDESLQEHLIRLWVRIATENKHRGDVIAGYDLLNEPSIPDPTQCGDKWNELVAVLVETIREIDDRSPIIIEPSGKLAGGDCQGKGGPYIGRLTGLQDLILPDDDNLIVSPHIYVPHQFTHQGVEGNPAGVSYPGDINNIFWDKNLISYRIQSIRDFHSTHPNIPILIGEFSVSRAAGPDGDVYLNDLISLMEDEGWGWTYHDLRGYTGWDPEMPYTDGPPYGVEATPRDRDAPRMILLREFYSKNN
ncbi:MAG: cellulase family glycosylhydrolase [Balneolales bacterium]